MNAQIPPKSIEILHIRGVLVRVITSAVVSALLIALSDGVYSIWSLSTVGLLTGPLTFLWWPYFRNEIGLQPLFGLVPLVMVLSGVHFRSKKIGRYIAYIGGVAWTLVGFFYMASHMD